LTLLAVISQRLLPKASGNGRVLAVEILRNNHACSALVREQKTHQLYSVIETGAKDGMITMDASLIRLYQRGIISREEAALHMRNPQALIEAIGKTAEKEKNGAERGRVLSVI